MPKLLLGEPNVDRSTSMKLFLSSERYTVQVETGGLRILECLRNEQFDVIVLDIALVGLDGISVVLDYRASGGSTPILLTSHKYSSDELKWGLDAGADAYLSRPFSMPDLAPQLRALLRRPAVRTERMLTSGLLTMDSGAGTLTKNNKPIHLHPMEFKLLQFLLSHPNQVFNAHALFQRVWQKDLGLTEDTVRTHIRTLRQKIDSEDCPSVIVTVRGLGYKTEKYVPITDSVNWGFQVIE